MDYCYNKLIIKVGALRSHLLNWPKTPGPIWYRNNLVCISRITDNNKPSIDIRSFSPNKKILPVEVKKATKVRLSYVSIPFFKGFLEFVFRRIFNLVKIYSTKTYPFCIAQFLWSAGRYTSSYKYGSYIFYWCKYASNTDWNISNNRSNDKCTGTIRNAYCISLEKYKRPQSRYSTANLYR